MRRWFVLGVAMAHAVTVRSGHAQGGPPLETDDPGTPGPGRLELNLALQAERQGGGTGYDAPLVDANLGVGDRLQLKLELPWRVLTAPARASRTGVGNLGLGIKWRFAESGPISVSTYPQVTLDGSAGSRAKGVADSGTTLLLPVELAWRAGRLSVGTELGYQLGPDEDEIVYGLAVGREVGSDLELLGECHGGGATDLGDEGVTCGGGLRWAMRQAMTLLAALEAGVAGSAERRPDRRLYLGLQLTW